MPQPIHYTTPLEPGSFFHIYNRGNNFQDVFKATEDYTSFLYKWREFIHPVAKTFAYNLLPNHFHALVQIRDAALVKASPLDLASLPSGLAKSEEFRNSGTPVWVSRAFTNFFISYARTAQNRHGFHGAVFHSPFKRKLIGTDLYFDYLTAYIHYNAAKHGLFSGALHEYRHSSYRALISAAPTLLERDYVLEYFGGREKFIAFHEGMADSFMLRDDLE